MKIKIVSYNILDGFHTRDKTPVFHKDRLDLSKKIVKKLDPDILVLIETCDGKKNEHGVDIDYSKEFNLPYKYQITSEKGYKHGCAVLSRFPFYQTIDKTKYHRKTGRVIIKVNGKLLTLDFVHPHPDLTEKDKVEFFTYLLKDKVNPYIIAGDFNSWSPEEAEDRDLKEIIRVFEKAALIRRYHDSIEESVKDRATCQTLRYLLSQGLIDTYTEINPDKREYTVPTDLLSSDKGAASRIDFIMCSDGITVINSGIIINKDTEKASDHYPIFAEIELD